LRAIIVAAVSTGAQAIEEKASIPQQLEACRATCRQRKWTVVEEIPIPGHSRNYDWLHRIVADCPEYARLVELIEGGTIDLVVTTAYDRLFRTDALRAQLGALCRQHNVQLYSIAQPVEPMKADSIADGSDSRLIIEAMSGVIAQIENAARRRRHRIGMINRVRRGLHPSNAPYGYEKDPGGNLVIVPEEAEWLRWIFERRAEGWGYGRIANILNDLGVSSRKDSIWYHSTIYNILHRSVYIGRVSWGPASAEGRHEPLISKRLWEAIGVVKKRHSAWQYNRTPAHALTGLATCGYCGWHMSAQVRKKPNYGFYRCSQYYHTGARRCRSNGHLISYVESHVLSEVCRVLNNPEAWADSQRQQANVESSSELATIETQLVERIRAKERWFSLFDSGRIPPEELVSHYEQVDSQIKALEKRREELERQQRIASEAVARAIELSDVLDALPQLPPNDLRAVYSQLLSAVELRKGEEPVIRWL
jgi:site-specific DNA recombinase